MQSPDPTSIFIVPVSGAAAQTNLAVSVSEPIQTPLASYLSTEQLKAAQSDGSFYAWGAKPGPRNDETWRKMRPGDYVLFYEHGLYSRLAKITLVLQNEELATALWGRDLDGNAWAQMYFLTHPVRVDVALDNLTDFLQSSHYQGFIRLPDERLAAITARYGSVSDFVAERLLPNDLTPTNFAIFRSNPDSTWEDQRGIYHYGPTVANHKKVRPGTAVVFDRKRSGAIELFGFGRVTDVNRREDGTIDAAVDFTPMEPRPYTPAEVNLLRTQPGYNAQHSIRPITASFFDILTGAKTTGQSLMDVDPPEQIAARLSWTVPRVNGLLKMLKRSNAVLFAGPPGTGKTFVAKVIAEALTSEPFHSSIVQFHPAYSYEDFIEGIRPKLNSDRLGYEMHRGPLMQMAQRAIEDPSAQYVLLLDELNRANVARVFGELIYALEYRGRGNTLALASGEDFYMPNNLLILATMNTADRSITGLDAALRRRFREYYLDPDYDALQTFLAKVADEDFGLRVRSRLERLNGELLDITGDRGRLIGHTYFMQAGIDDSSLSEIWDEQLAPLLNDYLFDRPDDIERLKAIYSD